MAKRKREDAASSSADAYAPPHMKCGGQKSIFTCRVGGCGLSIETTTLIIGQAYTQRLATAHAKDVDGVRTMGNLEFDHSYVFPQIVKEKIQNG
jgi:hypothetical protein